MKHKLNVSLPTSDELKDLLQLEIEIRSDTHFHEYSADERLEMIKEAIEEAHIFVFQPNPDQKFMFVMWTFPNQHMLFTWQDSKLKLALQNEEWLEVCYPVFDDADFEKTFQMSQASKA